MKKIIVSVLLLAAVTSWACLVNIPSGPHTKKVAKLFEPKNVRSPANVSVDFAEGHPSPSLESKLGNLLLEFRDVPDVVISLPVGMQTHHAYSPFGDKQRNARMNLGSYDKGKNFLAVGVQMRARDGKIKRDYIFAADLKITKFKETEVGNGYFKVQPDQWKDSFYFNFQTATMPIKNLLKGIPVKLRTFPDGSIAPNIGKIGKLNPYEELQKKPLGPGQQGQPYPSNNVHGQFPLGDEGKFKGEFGHHCDQGCQTTAVGAANTWGVVKKEFGPFKNIYSCIDARNIEEEKKQGVPSGAGWHAIGDVTETLLNTLSEQPLPVAEGRNHGRENAAYGLTTTITASWLQPDQALISPQGEFHWYLNPYEKNVCTEIWVHNCLPNLDNNWGFNCPWVD